mmetsp:Transcript_494/g.1048  ORF Transcript_494/g.1048 Transcript_494/m.1048 type:complete len:560 (-) Transcript_494:226-1905(-)
MEPENPERVPEKVEVPKKPGAVDTQEQQAKSLAAVDAEKGSANQNISVVALLSRLKTTCTPAQGHLLDKMLHEIKNPLGQPIHQDRNIFVGRLQSIVGREQLRTSIRACLNPQQLLEFQQAQRNHPSGAAALKLAMQEKVKLAGASVSETKQKAKPASKKKELQAAQMMTAVNKGVPAQVTTMNAMVPDDGAQTKSPTAKAGKGKLMDKKPQANAMAVEAASRIMQNWNQNSLPGTGVGNPAAPPGIVVAPQVAPPVVGPPDQEHMRVEELNDVTAISGINLQNEQEALLASKTFLVGQTRGAATVEMSLLNPYFLRTRVHLWQQRFLTKLGQLVTPVPKDEVLKLLEVAVQDRLRGVLIELQKISRQRVDWKKVGIDVLRDTSVDVRRGVRVIEKREKELEEMREAQERSELLRVAEAEKGSKRAREEPEEGSFRMKVQKVKQQEQDRHATSVANITAMAAIGDSRWAKWAEMASNEKKAVPAAASNSSGVAADKKEREDEDKAEAAIPTASNTMMASGSERQITLQDCVVLLGRDAFCKREYVVRLHQRMVEANQKA